jgi:hypothetical protein
MSSLMLKKIVPDIKYCLISLLAWSIIPESTILCVLGGVISLEAIAQGGNSSRFVMLSTTVLGTVVGTVVGLLLRSVRFEGSGGG